MSEGDKILKNYEPGPEQVAHLQAWLKQALAERILDSRAQTNELEITGIESLAAAIPGAIAPFSADPILPGQLRLLAPDILPEAGRPVYVAVLSEWDDHEVVVAPFSSYSSPSTPGELLLPERHQQNLQVLCLWNARNVHPAALWRSWLVDELADAERNAAWSVFLNVATGEVLSADLTKRTGPRILKAQDPRIEYQDRETRIFDPLSELPALVVLPETWQTDSIDEVLPMAAAAGVSTCAALYVPNAASGLPGAAPADWGAIPGASAVALLTEEVVSLRPGQQPPDPIQFRLSERTPLGLHPGAIAILFHRKSRQCVATGIIAPQSDIVTFNQFKLSVLDEPVAHGDLIGILLGEAGDVEDSGRK